MTSRRALLALALAAALPATAAPRTLPVAVAANLRDVAEAARVAFLAEHPGVEVRLTFGASGVFFAQLQQGAPFDLFLSADREYPAKLVAAGLARAEDERVYALGRLVAWTPPGSTLDLNREGLQGLTSPAVKRIAMANPKVAPFGRAALAALEAAGVAAAVKDKLVLGTSVGQAAQFASTGAAEVALLPASLARTGELAKGTAVALALPAPLEQSGVVLGAAKEPALARAFLDFLTRPKGRALLEQHGYGLP